MPFMDLAPRRKPRRALDHLMIASALGASVVIFAMADDEVTGRPGILDGCGFTALFAALGYFLGWLPAIWARARGTAIEALVTPAFVGLSLAYFYLGFRSYFVQPGATGPMLLTQLAALICLSCRAAAGGPSER